MFGHSRSVVQNGRGWRLVKRFSHQRAHQSLPERYESFVDMIGGRDDIAQRCVLEKLDSLRVKLQDHRWASVRPHNIWLSDRLPAALNSAFASSRAPQGLYLAGPVGSGKTMLMDMFIDHIVKGDPAVSCLTDETHPLPEQKKTTNKSTTTWALRRTHFHRFMLDCHQRMHRIKQDNKSENDPILVVAQEIVTESPLLCFDEFQVTDVADALILHRLFKALFAHGAVIVTTSNRLPSDLYEGGINRFLFMPFISLLKERCEAVDMAHIGSKMDYRLVHAEDDEDEDDFDNSSISSSGGGHKERKNKKGSRFLWPLNAASEAEFERQFSAHAAASASSEEESRVGASAAVDSSSTSSSAAALQTREVHLPVAHGRTLLVPRATVNGGMGSCARFTFQELFVKPLGAADFLALAQAFPVVFLEGVPRLDSSVHNETRRFITFLDILYEAGGLVVCTADAPLKQLFVEREVALGADERVDRDSMMGNDNNNEAIYNKKPAPFPLLVIDEGGWSKLSSVPAPRPPPSQPQQPRLTSTIPLNDAATSKAQEVSVSDVGGSSGRVTTMIGEAEWSATGLIGVSLAEYSAVNDVGFAFRRAQSRLIEMQTEHYAAQHRARFGGGLERRAERSSRAASGESHLERLQLEK